jgi:hypothetical protein
MIGQSFPDVRTSSQVHEQKKQEPTMLNCLSALLSDVQEQGGFEGR